MAIMFPKEEKYLNDKLPFSEREVYRVLSSLSDDYVIFHSVQWVNKKYSSQFTWYENDFLLLNKKYGILVLEVNEGINYISEGKIIQKNT